MGIREALGAVVGIFLQSFLYVRPELEREKQQVRVALSMSQDPSKHIRPSPQELMLSPPATYCQLPNMASLRLPRCLVGKSSKSGSPSQTTTSSLKGSRKRDPSPTPPARPSLFCFKVGAPAACSSPEPLVPPGPGSGSRGSSGAELRLP